MRYCFPPRVIVFATPASESALLGDPGNATITAITDDSNVASLGSEARSAHTITRIGRERYCRRYDSRLRSPPSTDALLRSSGLIAERRSVPVITRLFSVTRIMPLLIPSLRTDRRNLSPRYSISRPVPFAIMTSQVSSKSSEVATKLARFVLSKMGSVGAVLNSLRKSATAVRGTSRHNGLS